MHCSKAFTCIYGYGFPTVSSSQLIHHIGNSGPAILYLALVQEFSCPLSQSQPVVCPDPSHLEYRHVHAIATSCLYKDIGSFWLCETSRFVYVSYLHAHPDPSKVLITLRIVLAPDPPCTTALNIIWTNSHF
jgi:hypothetical protein